ncbi:MAG TPA: rhomboid family intramembrane serine protease [Nitrososphaeraceae archaeon]|jgi:membrane associated rhomboid family serine protease
MFPVHDDTQRIHGRPYLNYGLIAANVIVFIYEVVATSYFSNEAATNALMQRYGAIPNQVLSGDVTSIFTSMFLHGGLAHLVGNMVFLFVFGDNIEDKFGRIKYLLLYLMWGAAATIVHSLFAVSAGSGEIPAIGASGAISGILGAYLVMFPRARIYTVIFAFFITTVRIPAIAFIPFWFIMQIILGFIDPLGGVAYGAHIGGFLVGLATGYLWKTLRLYQQQPEASKPNWYYNKSKNRPNIDEMGVNAQPELIKGPDFYEIIAEIRGVTSTSEIKVDYDPNTNIMRIYSIAPSTSEVKIKLPDDVSNPQVNQIQYLNGIVRIRLR